MKRWLGWAVSGAGFAYLVVLASREGLALGPLLTEPKAWLALAAATGLLLGATALGVVLWWLLLRAQGAEIGLRRAMVVFGMSQAAKYLPGGVAHYVGRAVLGRADGLRWPALLASFALEAVSYIVAGASLGLGLTVVVGTGALRPSWPGGAGFVLLSGSVLVALAAALMLRGRTTGWLARRLGATELQPPGGRVSALSMALSWAIFLLSGLALTVLAHEIFGLPWAAFWRLTLWSSTAWLAGFLTPGAPAGLGVREALLVRGLEPLCGATEAVTLALALRVVATVADGATLAAAWWARGRSRRPPA